MACASPNGGNGSQADPGVTIEQLKAMMDSAGESFSAGDLFQSRALYERVIEADTTLSAAWYGLFLTQRALGDTSAANAAFQVSRRLAEPTSTAAAR